MSLTTLAQSPEFTRGVDPDRLAAAVRSWHVAARITDAIESADMLQADRDYIVAALNAYGRAAIEEAIDDIGYAVEQIDDARKMIQSLLGAAEPDTPEDIAEQLAEIEKVTKRISGAVDLLSKS